MNRKKLCLPKLGATQCVLEHEFGQHFKLDPQFASVEHVFLHDLSCIDDFSGQAPFFLAYFKLNY